MEEDDELAVVARTKHHLTTLGLSAETATWTSAAHLLSILDAIGRVRGLAFVKIDASRTQNVYTVFVGGGKESQEMFHKDGADLHTLLVDALRFYLRTAATEAQRQ